MGAPLDRLRRWDVDQWVAAASTLLFAAVVTVLLVDLRRGPARSAPAVAVARLSAVYGAVSWRGAGTLAWEAAENEQPLAAGDAVFVQPGGGAFVAFAAGALVEVAERSLVVVEPPAPREDRLQVVEGSVVAAAGGSSLGLRAGGAQAIVAPGGALSAEAGGRLELIEGKARVGAEEREATPAVRLLSPGRGHRLYASRFPVSVALRWEGEAARDARVEVSRERSFAGKVASAPGAAGVLGVPLDGPGAWYWRLADAGGRPISEVRRFTAVLDQPPRPYSPSPGEIVLAPQGVQTPFWWTAVEGASRYRVEVAQDAGFRRIALSESASGPGLWATLDFPEGIYHWRVRAERPGEEELPPPSAAITFRLIHRPVLEAPALYDPALEGATRAR